MREFNGIIYKSILQSTCHTVSTYYHALCINSYLYAETLRSMSSPKILDPHFQLFVKYYPDVLLVSQTQYVQTNNPNLFCLIFAFSLVHSLPSSGLCCLLVRQNSFLICLPPPVPSSPVLLCTAARFIFLKVKLMTPYSKTFSSSLSAE